MIFNEILRDGYNHCLFRSWTLSLDNIISHLKWYIFQGLMIISFLSKIITTVFYFLAYEVLTAITTLAGIKMHTLNVWFSSVQLLSHVPLFATPWIAARQASLSITSSRSSPKIMSIESVMPSSHLILCRLLLLLPPTLPGSETFPMSQLFAWDGQSIGVSALASFLPKNTHGWSPLGWTGWISLQSKGLSRVFSNTTVQKHQFFGAQPSSQSNSHILTCPLEKP